MKETIKNNDTEINNNTAVLLFKNLQWVRLKVV